MDDEKFIQWLLDSPTPSIRYLTLRKLLDRPQDDPQAQAAWRAMKTEGPIPAILAGQTTRGPWAGESSYYTPKYVSTHWSMMLLVELAADGDHPAMRRGATFMLDATLGEPPQWVRSDDHGVACFWGNLLRYTLHSGLQEDSRLPAVVARLANDALHAGWRCKYNAELPCAWGAARALWGLAVLPDALRSAEAEAAVDAGLAFLLEEYNLLEADYPVTVDGKISYLWRRLNFPLFYQADILFVLRLLGELGKLDHPGAAPALKWLEARRRADGHWRGASPFRQRTWRELGDRQETDRWVSLQAALLRP